MLSSRLSFRPAKALSGHRSFRRDLEHCFPGFPGAVVLGPSWSTEALSFRCMFSHLTYSYLAEQHPYASSDSALNVELKPPLSIKISSFLMGRYS